MAVLDRGLLVAIATARPYVSLFHRLEAHLLDRVSCVCSNGATIFRDGRCAYENALPPDVARDALCRLEEMPGDSVVSMEMGGRLFINQDLDTGPVPFEVGRLSQAVTGPVVKILATMGRELDEVISLPDLPVGCRATLTDGGAAATITAPGCSKEEGLRRLLEMVELEFGQVMAFDDDVNDVAMLHLSGIGLAMANAVPQALAVADRVAPSNEEDGVAAVLEELLREQPQPAAD